MNDTGTDLRRAIEAYVREQHPDFIPDDAMLGDYVVVCHWPTLGDVESGFYSVDPHDPYTPAHQVIGLLHLGIDAQGNHEGHEH